MDTELEKLSHHLALEDLVIIEHCADPDDQGRYWKYSAFIFEDEIVPAHLFVDSDWCVKGPKLMDDRIADLECAYVYQNPHEEDLKKVAGLANIDYGRMDYGLVEDHIQVYEINTNPIVMRPRDHYYNARRQARRESARLIEAAFRKLDTANNNDEIQRPPPMKKAWWTKRGLAYSLYNTVLRPEGLGFLVPAAYVKMDRMVFFSRRKGALRCAPKPSL